MTHYDINGTLFYNVALTLGAFNRHTSPFVRALLNLFEPDRDIEPRLQLFWTERLKHSRVLARAGVVHALAIRPGLISARVVNPVSKTMYAVKLAAPVADFAHWQEIAAHAAGEVALAAQIAHGDLPEAWLAALALRREQLRFEADGAQLRIDQPPEPFFAAAWMVFVHRVQLDPWLWVLFRGQTREGLLDLLQQTRAAQQRLDAAAGVDLDPALFWRHGAFAPIAPSPANELHVLRQLKTMPGDVRVGRRLIAHVLRKAMTARPGKKSRGARR